MNEQDEIIEMAIQAGVIEGFNSVHPSIEAFAKLIAERERERIIIKNAPVIKQCNDYIKLLETELAGIRARGKA